MVDFLKQNPSSFYFIIALTIYAFSVFGRMLANKGIHGCGADLCLVAISIDSATLIDKSSFVKLLNFQNPISFDRLSATIVFLHIAFWLISILIYRKNIQNAGLGLRVLVYVSASFIGIISYGLYAFFIIW